MGRRTAAAGDSAPAGDARPIFFLRHQKENAPRPVEKKKCSAGRSAQAQTSCRRRGKVGSPLRRSGAETRRPWGNLQPGAVRDTLSDSPRCRSRFFEEQPAAAKKEAAQCVNHPDAGAPSATGRQLQTRRRPKRARRSGKIGAGTDTPTPVRAEGRCTGARPALFSLPPGAAHSLFGQDQKENGGRIPRGNGPRGEVPPSHPLHFPIIFQIKEGTQSWIRF